MSKGTFTKDMHDDPWVKRVEATFGQPVANVQRTPNWANYYAADGTLIHRQKLENESLGDTLVKKVLPTLAIGGAAMAAAPAVLGGMGAAGAGAAGSAASTAGVGGALSKIPMLGGALSKGMGLIGGLDGALSLGAGIEGYEQDRAAKRLQGKALDRLGQEYSANAPLRDMGRTGMLNEQAPDLSSTFASHDNPYAPMAPKPSSAVPLGGMGMKPMPGPTQPLNPLRRRAA